MNAAQVLDHFNRISDAPDAIPRLRRFILDLAVRGKLVEQDSNDVSACELLNRIRTEKAQLVAERKIKAQEILLQPISDIEEPFVLPESWRWVRLIDLLTKLTDGTHHSPPNGQEGSFKYVTAKNIKPDGVSLSDITYVSADVHEEIYARCDPIKGDILYIKDGATTGVVTVNNLDDPFSMLSSVALLKLPSVVYNRLLVAFLSSPFFYDQMRGFMKGAAITRVTLKRMAPALIPLPPLTEQHRIVAKVDELMALCDRLEEAQAERESRRDKLAASSLHRLNNGADADEFREHARFHLRHLPRLTARPEHIQQLRQTILNLAVRGKLVRQDPSDEPASELVKRINAEKERMEKGGKIKKEKPVDAVNSDTAPFRIPASWTWTRLGKLTQLITKGSSPKWQGIGYVSKDEGVLFITSENVWNYRLRKLDELKYVEKRFNEIEPRSILRFGDILMNLVGASIGRTAIYDLRIEANINQAVALIRLIQTTTNLSTGFLLHYLNSPSAIEFMFSSQVVTAQPNLSLTNAREFPIPVPPLPEQHRIVANINELMALCDRLETQLTTTQTESRRLLEAVLHEALKLRTGNDRSAHL